MIEPRIHVVHEITLDLGSPLIRSCLYFSYENIIPWGVSMISRERRHDETRNMAWSWKWHRPWLPRVIGLCVSATRVHVGLWSSRLVKSQRIILGIDYETGLTRDYSSYGSSIYFYYLNITRWVEWTIIGKSPQVEIGSFKRQDRVSVIWSWDLQLEHENIRGISKSR